MKFGRLTVLREAETRTSTGKRKYVCVCECGNTCEPWAMTLTRGRANSCGCLRADTTRKRRLRHGKSRTAIHRIWTGILYRCLNPSSRQYADYGGRGIQVCQRWQTFELFYADMGDPPYLGATIDRVDVNGHYELYNCVWSTAQQQARNRRNNHLLEFDGRSLPISAWAEILGVSKHLIRDRVMRGWSVEDALTVPRGMKRKP